MVVLVWKSVWPFGDENGAGRSRSLGLKHRRSQCGRYSCTALSRAAAHTPHCCRETCLDGLKSSSTVSQNKAFKLYLSSIVVTAMQNYQKLVSVVKQRFETQTKEFYQVCCLSQTFLREILPQIKEPRKKLSTRTINWQYTHESSSCFPINNRNMNCYKILIFTSSKQYFKSSL